MILIAYLLKAFVATAVISPLESALPSGGYGLPSLLDATVGELRTGLENREFSSVDLVNAYIARILEVNGTLHMVTEINPDALKIAKELDDERKAGKCRGALHGIPILIKNNIATADLMNNTAGSYALLGAKVPRDSTVAAKLRQAGAVILGKTNLSQWANFRSSNSSNGWSAYGGQTYGAYYPKQDPSGSSSGSGVASSLGLAAVSLGSETDGSIISPSQVNNLVGIKPTVGLTSRTLVIPISEHQDTVGPMARTVKDAAVVLQAIAGPDPADNYTLANPFNGTLPDYVGACKLDALKGKRIGVPRNYIGTRTATSAPIFDAFEAALVTLTEAGATVVDNTNYTAYNEYVKSNTEGIVLDSDFVANLASYLAQLTYNPTGVKSLADVRNFTQSFGPEEYPSRDTATWDESLALNFTNSDAEARAAYQYNQYLGGAGGILGALANYSLDAVVTPSRNSPGISAIIGAPIVTVPLGAYPNSTLVRNNSRGNLVATASNIPFGISFSGAKWSEESLIGFAYAFEQRSLVREKVKPYLLPKTELADVVGYKAQL
ncbi:amidase signature enzyme [Bimuria novae-zelandiae CBS 107.79]|uniref:Amidase signature enzyme n=1 Tax=Bimuria novae-zelandiae CBS 107.79 TaxID=1447943 RepID=A0A6A5VI42_9PLEO|nr:amidase signature enzyme [Bimuria novae-zelandiae CBS 107.79]